MNPGANRLEPARKFKHWADVNDPEGLQWSIVESQRCDQHLFVRVFRTWQSRHWMSRAGFRTWVCVKMFLSDDPCMHPRLVELLKMSFVILVVMEVKNHLRSPQLCCSWFHICCTRKFQSQCRRGSSQRNERILLPTMCVCLATRLPFSQ